ncbi:putative short-chain dehydrogenase [Xylariaceae sp. FL1272]|nr:putative short-chain dehydrogenase [Xylariaceae sp. FL1272]
MAATNGTFLIIPTVIIGANGGLGVAVVQQMLSSEQFAAYHGLYAVRDAQSASALQAALSSKPPHSHDVVSIDLDNMDSVRTVAQTINARVAAGTIPLIQVLVLNAGFQDFDKQVWTSDGFDRTFTANYLGQWLLTLLLPESMNTSSGRIVVIGSQSHDAITNPFDKRNDVTYAFTDERYREVLPDRDKFQAIAKGSWSSAAEDPSWASGYRRYGAAKLFLIMMIHELQHRIDRDPVLSNISVLGVDPGTMTTGLQRHASWFTRVFIFQIVYPIMAFLIPNGLVRTTSRSASQVLRADFDSNDILGEFPKGLYLFDDKLWESSAEAREAQKRKWTWTKSIQYTNLVAGETLLEAWA